METYSKSDNETIEISTTQTIKRKVSKSALLAQKAKIETMLAEFDKP